MWFQHQRRRQGDEYCCVFFAAVIHFLLNAGDITRIASFANAQRRHNPLENFSWQARDIKKNPPLFRGHKTNDNNATQKSLRYADKEPVDQEDIPVASITVPLHSHSGTHHVYLHIGSPIPQRQTLILDTGSRYLAFPCRPYCQPNQCGRHASHSYFDATLSTTLRNNTPPNCVYSRSNKANNNSNTCTFHLSYMEGSGWTAQEIEDLVWLGTEDIQESTESYMPHLAVPFTFGCQTSIQGDLLLKQHADGILGLAFAQREHSFLNTMVRANAIQRHAFSTCMTRAGGTLSLGGSGTIVQPQEEEQRQQGRKETEDFNSFQYHMEPMSFTRMAAENDAHSKSGYYTIPLNKILLGDECITCSDSPDPKQNTKRQRAFDAFRAGKGVLLDSGSTDTYFNKASLPVFADIWTRMTGMKLVFQQKYTYDQFRTIPDITFVFEPNATLVVPASHYMEGVPMTSNGNMPEDVKPWTGYRRLFLRIYFDDPTGAVLGINAMYNYDILYDLQGNRIGLARSYCGS